MRVINVNLNGKKIQDFISEDELLLDFVRRHGAKSVKRGCDTSNCGICSLFVDEKIVLSCSVLAYSCEGKSIKTSEGLLEETKDIRRYIAEEGADQCGFCNPGFVMSALALSKEYENPDDETIREFLSGNLCRCTGYSSQARALRKYFDDKQSL